MYTSTTSLINRGDGIPEIEPMVFYASMNLILCGHENENCCTNLIAPTKISVVIANTVRVIICLPFRPLRTIRRPSQNTIGLIEISMARPRIFANSAIRRWMRTPIVGRN